MLKIAWSPLYCHPLPVGHRFPMEKYELIPEQLLYEGSIEKENLFEPKVMDEETILLTHSNSYWTKLISNQISAREARKTGFPFSQRLLKRGRIIAQGTLDNVSYARSHGVALNIAGGTHHAYRDHGEGFCILNDMALASNYLLTNKLSERILIIDLDVHQGNGTASIFQAETRVFTFSMHCEANYPLKKEASDLDIGLPLGCNGEYYLNKLKETLPILMEQHQPDLVFYLAGVDVLATDKLGKLALTKNECKERDRFVFESCKNRGLAVVVSLGGGYSPAIKDIVDAHCNTFRLAIDIWD